MLNRLIKQQLGPSMCTAKWTNSTIHLGIGRTHSCHHPHPHEIPLSEINVDSSALHNTQHKKQVRKQMLEGVCPSECNYCWNIENAGGIGDRVLMSRKDGLREYLKIKNTSWDSNYDPTYLEISFSNVCNFACAYCGPEYSSKWHSEIKQKSYPNNYNGIHVEQIPDREQNPYIDAFWKYFPTVYKNLRVLRITGGEPFMSRHTEDLINFIKYNPNKKLTLIINSNLGVPAVLFDKHIQLLKTIKKCVKKIEIATSGEGYKEKAEYVRDGLVYDYWRNNCDIVAQHFYLNIMCAYNIFSVTSFEHFLSDIKNIKNVKVSISAVRDPSFMSASVMPSGWINNMYEQLEFIKKHFSHETQERFKQVIAHASVKTNKTAELVSFIKEYDKRRNKNFAEIFPEYKFIIQQL